MEVSYCGEYSLLRGETDREPHSPHSSPCAPVGLQDRQQPGRARFPP